MDDDDKIEFEAEDKRKGSYLEEYEPTTKTLEITSVLNSQNQQKEVTKDLEDSKARAPVSYEQIEEEDEDDDEKPEDWNENSAKEMQEKTTQFVYRVFTHFRSKMQDLLNDFGSKEEFLIEGKQSKHTAQIH